MKSDGVASLSFKSQRGSWMDTKPKRFGFLVNYVENWNWLFNFRPDLQMEEAQRRRALWPVCSLMSLWYLAGLKSFNLLDSFHFNGHGSGAMRDRLEE